MAKRTGLVFALSVALLLIAAPIAHSQSTATVQTGYAEVNGLKMYSVDHKKSPAITKLFQVSGSQAAA
jgi:hypothetical protein